MRLILPLRRSLQRIWIFKSRAFARALIVAGLAFFMYLYLFQIEPSWIDIHTLSLKIPHLAKEFNGYRLIQITDVHVDNWMNLERLSNIIDIVNHQEPNLVVITGDFVSKKPEKYANTLTSGLQKLHPKDGVLAVLGNHDVWTNAQIVAEAIEKAGVKLLHNEVFTLKRGEVALNIAGFGDVWTKQADLDLVLKKLPTDGIAIALVHEPDFADETAATGRFALQLSGHSHGGQVRIPFVKQILPPFGIKYPAGLYKVNEMLQYTSRGLGTVNPKVRFNCRPEITVIKLIR